MGKRVRHLTAIFFITIFILPLAAVLGNKAWCGCSTQTIGSDTILTSVWGTSSTNLFAVGLDGTILRTTNNGSTWNPMDSHTQEDLEGVCATSTYAIAVGDYGTICKYTQASGAWSLVAPITSTNLTDCWCTGDNIFVVGRNGAVLRSTNGGTNWAPMASATSAKLNSVWGSSASDVYAVGNSYVDGANFKRTIVRYNGTSWSKMDAGTGFEHLFGVWGSSSSDIYAAGTYGLMLHYNGSAWSSAGGGMSDTLYDVWGSSASSVFAAGYKATMEHYNGTQWYTVYEWCDTSERLYGVWSDSPTNMFAVGEGGVIVHYTGSDDDGDGKDNYIDNCPTVSNSDQTDTDADGIGDACDNCGNKYNPKQGDRDGNCPAPPYTSDPQCGDVCKTMSPCYVYISSIPDEITDTDCDSMIDEADKCAGQYNPLQVDTDGDGIGDACDNCPYDENGSMMGTCTVGNVGQLCNTQCVPTCDMLEEECDKKCKYQCCTEPDTPAGCDSSCLTTCKTDCWGGWSDFWSGFGEWSNHSECVADCPPDCGVGGVCSILQEDTDQDGIGDVCDTGISLCKADTNGDNKVNLTDLGKLKGEFGRTNCNPANPTYCCKADTTGDNKVNLTDLGKLKGEFGRTNCPARPARCSSL
jgi:photosystem II stability/assembly factor-like uncharacterized protein